jgi:hypothetical protein
MTGVRVGARPAPGERLALFAECVLVGLFTLIAALPVVTLLPALGAGCDHLAAHVDGRSTALSAYPRRLFRACAGGGLALGVLLALALAVLALDLVAIRRGVPGALPVALICGVAGVALLVVVLRAAAFWRTDDAGPLGLPASASDSRASVSSAPADASDLRAHVPGLRADASDLRAGGAQWRALLSAAARRAVADPSGSLLLAAGLGMLVVTTWQLLPLAIPMTGCVLMAALAVERRNPVIG